MDIMTRMEKLEHRRQAAEARRMVVGARATVLESRRQALEDRLNSVGDTRAVSWRFAGGAEQQDVVAPGSANEAAHQQDNCPRSATVVIPHK